MKLRHLTALALTAAPLAACAGAPQTYPQPYIGSGAPIAVTPEVTAAFKARTLHSPPRSDIQDLAESYIASSVAHPTSVTFTGEFESVGKSMALCGLVKYKDETGQMTGWRPFFVEWTVRSTKGIKTPYYNPDTELAKLCGPMGANAN